MNVTVTGATGTLGLACIEMLIRAGHRVRAFVRRPDVFRSVCSEERVQVVEGDILDRRGVTEALVGSDGVVHCVDFPPSRYASSWDALRYVLEGLEPGTEFVYPGNLWVYGPSESGRVGPEHPKESPARLGTLKADLEKVVIGEGGTVVRLPEVYGPGVRKGRLADMFRKALAGKTVFYPGSLDRYTEFSYIGDAARALIAPLGRSQARGAEYTAPGCGPVTVRAFVSQVFKAAGQIVRLRSIPIGVIRILSMLRSDGRVLRDLTYVYERSISLDGTKIRRELGWMAEVDYADGVRRTIRWLRQPGSSATDVAVDRERRVRSSMGRGASPS